MQAHYRSSFEKRDIGCDIVAALRAPLENYPPSLNQVQLLAEAGRRIVVVDVKPHDEASHGFWKHPNVARIRAEPMSIGANFFQRAEAAARFSYVVRRTVSERRPRVVIAYDPYAMVATGRPNAFNIWHFHELFDENANLGVLNRNAVRFATRNARHVDIVIFPDADRSTAFSEFARLSAPIEVVNNCPRRLKAVPDDLLRPRLAELGLPQSALVVLFQGWIGSTYSIEQTVISMPHWPADAYLVLIGPVEPKYRKKLTGLAAEMAVAEKLIFLGRLPYEDLLAYTVGADIGLSIVSDKLERGLNLRYTAGASNKRFEYMACGLPQVANKGPGMHELIEARGVGVLVSHDDPADIGNAIGALITDKHRLKAMGSAARKAHLDLFNYEDQFSAIATRIAVMCDTQFS